MIINLSHQVQCSRLCFKGSYSAITLLILGRLPDPSTLLPLYRGVEPPPLTNIGEIMIVSIIINLCFYIYN